VKGEERLELVALTIKEKAKYALEKLREGDIKSARDELESIIRVLEGIIIERREGDRLSRITI